MQEVSRIFSSKCLAHLLAFQLPVIGTRFSMSLRHKRSLTLYNFMAVNQQKSSKNQKSITMMDACTRSLHLPFKSE